MQDYQKPDYRPGWWTVLKDWIKRALKGERHLPPWWLRDVGGGDDFRAVGQEFLELFVQIGGLEPDERVLDVGCGSGRMAIPLTGYLSPAGSYVGLDITRRFIDWCQRHISKRYPNFQFLHVDLYNKRYNPAGRYLAHEYRFPFDDRSFDFVFLTSVLTHLLPEATENYLREVARLLAEGGRGFLTFFLLNPTQQTLAEQGRNDVDFCYGPGPYRLRDEAIPESAVAYEEGYLFDLLAACDLALEGPVRYGTWSGRPDGLSYQDVLLVRRQGSTG